MNWQERAEKLKNAFSAAHIPNAEQGEARITSFAVSEHDAEMSNMRAAFSGRSYALIEPGTYKSLHVGSTLMMSDTPMEYVTHRSAVGSAKGHVLAIGLGLGCFVRAALANGQVDRVTVLEKSQDVIDLVRPTFSTSSVEIICADGFAWKWPKGTEYNFVWHDIWPNICADNKTQMSKLRRRYGRLCGGNQNCWSEGLWR